MTVNVQTRQISAPHSLPTTRSNRRRVSNCGNFLQNRAARAPKHVVQRTCALPELSGKQQQVEAAALHVLDQHCKQNSSQAASDVAMQLLREVVSTQKVKPELALGATRRLELHADVNQGA